MAEIVSGRCSGQFVDSSRDFDILNKPLDMNNINNGRPMLSVSAGELAKLNSLGRHQSLGPNLNERLVGRKMATTCLSCQLGRALKEAARSSPDWLVIL